MTTVKQSNLEALFKQGFELAAEEQRHVLISHVMKIKPLDPFSFFEAGLSHYKGKRFFWSNPSMSQVFIGLGSAYNIEAYGRKRFEEAERRWRALCEGRIVSPDTGIKGTGPLLFGGFSFDPLSQKDALWDGFPDSALVLPELLLTVTAEGCWLTVNEVTAPGRRARERAERLQTMMGFLIDKAQSMPIRLEDIAQGKVSSDALNVEAETWKSAVAEAARQIRHGVMEKVVLAREVRVKLPRPLHAAYALKHLCTEQAESFVFAIERGEACFLGASPERLVMREGDTFYSTCLASSIGRGKSKEEDEALGETLLNDEKYVIEHKIVVDMIKEAMADGCEWVNIPAEPTLFKARYIQHLYTPVMGKALPGTTLLNMVERLHPTPALGGYPQRQTMAKIREMEGLDRGWYAAPVGWMDAHGDGEFIGAIRSGVVRGREASIFVGCGIVADSDPEMEFAETNLKRRPMLSALGAGAHD